MKIYIDENLPPQLAEALNLLQNYHNINHGVNIEILSITGAFESGVQDEDWIPKIGGSYVITKDCNIKKRKNQRQLFLDNNIGMFFISAQNLNFWETTRLLIHNWESLLKIIRKEKTPFAYKANSIKNGFKRWS